MIDNKQNLEKPGLTVAPPKKAEQGYNPKPEPKSFNDITNFHRHTGADQPKIRFTDLQTNIPIMSSAPTGELPDGKMILYDDGADQRLYVRINGAWVYFVKGPVSSSSIKNLWCPPQTGASVGTFTILGNTPVLNLVDGSDKQASAGFYVPTGFSISSIKCVWTSTAAAGNLYWSFNIEGTAHNEAKDSHSFGTAAAATATLGANKIYAMDCGISAANMASFTAGDYIGILFLRYGGSGFDTLSATVSFLGFMITFI